MEIEDSDFTRKTKYDSYDEAICRVADKKIKTIVNKIQNNIMPQLIETYRYIYSLPKDKKNFYSKVLEKEIGTMTYKRKAQRLGKIKIVKNTGKDG